MVAAAATADGSSSSYLPTPKITQNGLIPFRKWVGIYDPFIRDILDNIRDFLVHVAHAGDRMHADAAYDWDAMLDRLARYLYACSQNRFKSFRMNI